MSARNDIENTLYRYALLYDVDELDDIGSCFAVDAVVEFNPGNASGRAAVAEEMERRRAKYRPQRSIPWHVISNVLIENETETHADVTAFYTFFVKAPDEAPAPAAIGYYDDRFVREDGCWRIEARRVVHL